MTDNWKSYICNVNDSVASIFVNLGLRDEVPILSKTWLLWTWVYFQSPRSDGLSDSAEAPTLFKIEDALDSNIARYCRAIASVFINPPTLLWTRDKQLRKVTEALGIHARLP
jgi:Family of unknown function (DUF695)